MDTWSANHSPFFSLQIPLAEANVHKQLGLSDLDFHFEPCYRHSGQASFCNIPTVSLLTTNVPINRAHAWEQAGLFQQDQKLFTFLHDTNVFHDLMNCVEMGSQMDA